jgi:large subunit ribosomal protein L30
MPDLKVTQIRSGIGTKPKHRGTLRALGLGRIGKTNTLPDRPEIRGMIARVPHLIRVESGTEASGKSAVGSASEQAVPERQASAASAERGDEQ